MKEEEDYQHFIDKYGDDAGELFWDHLPDDGVHRVTTKAGVSLTLYVTVDTEHGLEGFYSSEISGSIETQEDCYEFTVRDVFCSETVLEIFERDVDFVSGGSILETDKELRGRIQQRRGLKPTTSTRLVSSVTGDQLDSLAALVGLERKGTTATLPNNVVSKEIIMSNNITKNVATVILLDNDKSVKTSQSVVATFADIVYTGDEQQLINQILINEDVKGAIEKHNDSVRAKTLNLTILERSGNEVMLRPIEFSDLVIQVK